MKRIDDLKRPRGAWLRTAAIAGAALMLAVVATPVVAQDATPVSTSPYDPANCTTEMISTDHMASLLATPVSQPELPTDASGVVVLPAGGPVSETDLALVSATLEQLWACNNARNKAAVYALFTDQAIQETIGFTEGSSWDAADLRADVAAALTPGDPRSSEEWATVNAIVSTTAYDDGQIGVLILNTDPLVADGDQVLDYFRFIIENGVAKVSGVVLDPYDLTSGYGFEKVS
ncbi:MAG: hypothetical protein E6R14_09160 [Thermomicrobiales bacterium]|nr:MAG: hypothetical protein E6R14_09160 [Thermomicrobiales bacterium]